MQKKTTRKDIFNVVDAFFAEKSLNWTHCSSICTDAAASMTGTIKGFVTLARGKKAQREIDSLYYTQRGIGIKKNEFPTT